MYEDRTSENIMLEMLEEVEGEDIDKSEGSLIWHGISKMAFQLEEAYESIANVYDNLMVDTMDLDHLISFGSELGIPIKDATSAVLKLVTNCAFEEGDAFEHTEQDFSYTIIETIDAENHIYKVECDEIGSEPNKYLGEVEPEDFVDEFETGELTELLRAGTDEEEEEEYRERIMNTWDTRAFAGNKAYYVEEVAKIAGVGAVKAERVTNDNTTVKLTILNESFCEPSADVIASVQEEVDPLDKTGEGNGIAPIGANVRVYGATAVTISVEAELILEDGIEIEDIESQLDGLVDEYFTELASNWEKTAGQIVRRAKIEAKIANVEGIVDITSVTLNGSNANITIGNYEIAKRGTTSWNTH